MTGGRAEVLIRRVRSAGLIFLLAAAAQTSPARERFLVVQHVERLIVYNTYQQEATPEERQALAPFRPLRVLADDELLGDGFTRCMKVSAGQSLFYLLKEQGTLAGMPSLGFVRLLEGTPERGDTLEVLAPLSSLQPLAGLTPRTVRRGDRLVRYFRSGEGTFVGLLADPPAFGWVQIPEAGRGRSWRLVVAPAAATSSVTPRAEESIRRVLDRVNRLLASLYAGLNERSHRGLRAPQWRLLSSGNRIACQLDGRAPDYARSTQYVAREIENAVLGSNLAVSFVPGSIEIGPR